MRATQLGACVPFARRNFQSHVVDSLGLGRQTKRRFISPPSMARAHFALPVAIATGSINTETRLN